METWKGHSPISSVRSNYVTKPFWHAVQQWPRRIEDRGKIAGQPKEEEENQAEGGTQRFHSNNI